MTLSILKKEIVDLYSTPIIQQTSFWSMVKRNQGVESSAFDFNARNRDLYSNVGGYSCTQADFVMFLVLLTGLNQVLLNVICLGNLSIG